MPLVLNEEQNMLKDAAKEAELAAARARPLRAARGQAQQHQADTANSQSRVSNPGTNSHRYQIPARAD